MRSTASAPALTIHGTDYDTPDGTCIRDYVHVMDLVDAHVLGLHWLEDGQAAAGCSTLAPARGFSVREVIDHSRVVTNRDVPVDDRAAAARRLHQAGVGQQPRRGGTGLACRTGRPWRR